MLVVRDREAGNIIEIVNTIDEGLELIKEYELIDQNEGTYTEDFYEVAAIEESTAC